MEESEVRHGRFIAPRKNDTCGLPDDARAAHKGRTVAPSADEAMLKRAVTAWLLALAVGCTRLNPSGTPAAQRTHPHELRIGDIGDVTTLNPLLSSDLVVSWMSQLTMAYLVRYDRANRPIPELATVVPSLHNGGISADGKTLTYHVRHDATWSDGRPLDADDVVFSTRLVLDPKTNVPSREGWNRIMRIDEPDKYTVVFHLRTPYAPYAATFFSSGGANPAIMPKHLLARTKNINQDGYNALPLGAGPFKYVRWLHGDRIELVANPRYWRGRPKLERISYHIIPNRETLLAALQTGDVDLWADAAPAYFVRAKMIPGFTVLRQPSYTYGHLDFNLTHANVAERTVRRALLLAFDRRVQREKSITASAFYRTRLFLQPHRITISRSALRSTIPRKRTECSMARLAARA